MAGAGARSLYSIVCAFLSCAVHTEGYAAHAHDACITDKGISLMQAGQRAMISPKKWWDDKASGDFQHLDPKYVKRTEQAWQKFLTHFDWKGKKVLDYGIGGGYLGDVLFKDYGIVSYAGVDISQKALDASRANLAKYNATNNVTLAMTPIQFSNVSPDIFVSQQVIQHFPSVDYFESFLENVDKSNAKQVMLHFRASKNGTTFSTDAYSDQKKGLKSEVTFALLADKDFIARHLKNYKLVWSDTNPMCCGTTGVYTGWDRK